MALRAVGAELPFVLVLVTGGALVHGHTGPVLEDGQRITGALVAFETIGGLVLAVQLERRGAVVEAVLAVEDLERGFAVALGAGVREVGVVRIGMAGFAVRVREVPEIRELLAALHDRLVALFAINRDVLPLQLEVRSCCGRNSSLA
ncbi:MAG: hypothetical protein IPH53_17825 [Flavobacteriales bacterium]|nr:hypothetical protein [Flavobacteriales bacterium]